MNKQSIQTIRLLLITEEGYWARRAEKYQDDITSIKKHSPKNQQANLIKSANIQVAYSLTMAESTKQAAIEFEKLIKGEK